MPSINTYSAGNSSFNATYASFPFSPDSYSLPRSITSPTNPESPLLPTNSPTFLVSAASSEAVKPAAVFKVPTSPISTDHTGDGVNSFAEWLEIQGAEDEDQGLMILFPSYHAASAASSPTTRNCLFSGTISDDASSAEDDDDNASEGETTDSDASSRSSSPSLDLDLDLELDSDLEGTENMDSCATASEAQPSTTAHRRRSPEPPLFFAEDDIAVHVAAEPQHGVDYLAHQWSTADLWASYRYVHAHHNSVRASDRLKNALWRTWWRDHEQIKRVDPEVIHWLKDSDITWLYGPFQPTRCAATGPKESPSVSEPLHAGRACRSLSHQPTRPPTPPTKSLVKRRKPAESMRQRSEYSLSLLRQAAGQPPLPPVLQPDTRPAARRSGKIGNAHVDVDRHERRGRRVVFNEVVVVYREVVREQRYVAPECDFEAGHVDHHGKQDQ